MGGRDRVALVLALGITIALNVVTAGVLYDAVFSKGPGLSSNATQLLTLAFGGIIGVVGSYLGFKAGQASQAGGGGGEETVVPPQGGGGGEGV